MVPTSSIDLCIAFHYYCTLLPTIIIDLLFLGFVIHYYGLFNTTLYKLLALTYFLLLLHKSVQDYH